jgi:hypothetical protein
VKLLISDLGACRWSWRTIPYVGGGGATEPEQTLELTIKGEALGEITQGRVLAYGTSWHPVKLLGALITPRLPRSLQRPGILDWLQSQWREEETEPHLRALLTMPMAIASQVPPHPWELQSSSRAGRELSARGLLEDKEFYSKKAIQREFTATENLDLVCSYSSMTMPNPEIMQQPGKGFSVPSGAYAAPCSGFSTFYHHVWGWLAAGHLTCGGATLGGWCSSLLPPLPI